MYSSPRMTQQLQSPRLARRSSSLRRTARSAVDEPIVPCGGARANRGHLGRLRRRRREHGPRRTSSLHSLSVFSYALCMTSTGSTS